MVSLLIEPNLVYTELELVLETNFKYFMVPTYYSFI